ncbi:MAG: flagellar export protein FliJ [Synergistaceae bacterium]|jgi:flagellar export protein FliJ|nr:flagellar export protein FliJ [Synergistaceae bacterium]
MGKEVARFNKILHVRAVERELTQNELAGRLQEEGAILERINALEEDRDSALADFCAGRGEPVSPQQMWLERQNIDVMESGLCDGRHALEECRFKIEETRAELVEKHQNVQLMERFVDRLKERAHKEMIDLEQKNLDDITSMRYRLNMQKEAKP